MRRRRSTHRGAFTLIELVASAVLTAMMMAGLMGIVWSASRDVSQLKRDSISRFPATLLIERLRTDLQNARGMQVDPRGVTLHGFVSHQRRTLRPTLASGRVRYERRDVAGRGVLVRTEQGFPTEPVWFGFSSLRIEPLQLADPEDQSLPLLEAGGLPEVPQTFRVTVTGDRGQTLWREVIHHHES